MGFPPFDTSEPALIASVAGRVAVAGLAGWSDRCCL